MATVKNDILLASRYDGAGAKQAIRDANAVRDAWLAAAKAAAKMPSGGGGGRAPTAPRAPSAPRGPDPAAQAAKAEAALLRLANAQARLAAAQGDAQGAANAYAAVLPRLTSGSLQAIQAQTGLERATNAVARSSREAGAGMAVLPRTIAGLSHEAANAAKNLVTLGGAGAVIGTLTASIAGAVQRGTALVATIQSTRAAIDVQLQGIRDTGQVYAEAGRFADTYKLTQQELNSALSTAAPLLRTSSAGIGEVLGVLSRLQVLNPAESIEGAAVALRELSSGDIVSLAERFNVSKTAANAMKAEIAGGADAVQVLGRYLDGAGVGMDALKAKTEGVSGALKDLALAQEARDLAFGQIGASEGGLAIIEAQTQAYIGLARVLGGDGGLATSMEGIRQNSEQLAQGFAAGAAAGMGLGVVGDLIRQMGFDAQATAAAVEVEAAANQNAASSGYEFANAATIAATTAQMQANAAAVAAAENMNLSGQLGIAAVQAGYAAEQQEYAALASRGLTQAQIDQALATQQAGIESQKLANFQATLAGMAGSVAGGHLSEARAAASLAERYNIAYHEALKLIQAQLQLSRLGGLAAGAFKAPGAAAKPTGAVGIVGTRAGNQRVGVGVGGVVSDAESEAIRKARTAATRAAAGGGGGKGKAKGAGGGGAAGAADQRAKEAAANANRLAQIEAQLGGKLADIDMATQEKLLQIDAQAGAKRAEAMRKLNEEIAKDATMGNFDETLNDFDLFNKDLKDEQRAALEEREAAELNYQQRVAAAGEEARKIAADGDAEYADEYYRIQKEKAERQKEIEMRAAEAVRQGGDADAVAAKAAEATKASEEEAARQIAIAQAASDTRKQEVEDAKTSVIDASDEQKRTAIQNANDAAEGLKSAAKIGTDAVVQGYKDQVEAANKAKRAAEDLAKVMKDLPAPPTAPATPTATEGGAEGGGTSTGGGASTGGSTGGGQGLRAARGGTSAPSSGGASALIGTLADAQAIIVWLSETAQQNAWNKANDLPNFIKRLELATGSIQAIIDLSAITKKPISPIDPKAVEAMVEDLVTAVTILGTRATGALNTLAQRVSIMSNAAQLTMELLGKMAEFRKGVVGEDGKLAAPIPPEYIAAMIAEAERAVKLLSEAFARNTYSADFRKNLGEWVDGAGAAIDLINGAADLSRNLQEPVPPIPADVLARLADATEQAVRVVSARLQPLTEQEVERLTAWSESAGAAIGVLSSAAALDADTQDVDGYVPWHLLNNLADTTRDALAVIQGRLLPLTDQEVQALQRWTESAGAAIDTLSAAASFAADVQTMKADGYVPIALMQRLATLSADALKIVQGVLLPVTEEQRQALERWQASSGAAVDTLAAVASLYTDLKDVPAGALSVDLMLRLAQDAQNALAIVKGTLRPVTEAQAAEIQRWADASTASIDALGGALSLRQAFADAAGAPDPTVEQLLGLADTNRRALQVLDTVLIPITEQQTELYGNYADAVGSGAAAFQAAIGLSGAMFADYRSPTDAQLNLIAADAGRIVDKVAEAAATLDTAGLEAAQQYGDALSSIVGGFTQQLQFNAALASGDFALDLARLDTFVESGHHLLRAASTLGAEAAAIPAGHLSALNNTSAALTGFAEAAIQMNAVPLNVPSFGGMGGGGGGTNITFAPGSIVVQAAQGMNPDQVANLAVTKIEAKLRAYR